MASIYGKNIVVSVFGQSHAPAIGVTVDGLPAGQQIDMQALARFMARRAPGQNAWSTARREADAPKFLCGLSEGKTCGAPLTAVIENTNVRSRDYSQLRELPRPGHADYTAQVKYGGFQDVAGGGHFSGRLTAPICIAGGICMQLLAQKGIHVGAHAAQVAGVDDRPFDPVGVSRADFEAVWSQAFPVLDPQKGAQMCERIEQARMAGDSVGGVIECAVIGLPAGIGDPMFDGMENRIAQAVFGVPAVKGIEFGNGFGAAALLGSQNNDAFATDGVHVFTKTNRHGGILGGITSGMPVLFRAAIKPTPSIAQPQDTVSLPKMENASLNITGRHDPCIVARAVPVIEAAAAIAVLDAMLEKSSW